MIETCFYILDRFDHEPGDDHSEAVTGLSACPRLKLYASASIDGTIRIWNDSNMLVRYVNLLCASLSSQQTTFKNMFSFTFLIK